MKIAIINGPNLNLTGTREPHIYGNESLSEYLERLAAKVPHELTTFQSNIEGEIIDEIQRAGTDADAIILNAGAYTHYSIAIADAVRAVAAPAVEVHISNIAAREEFRRHSVVAPYCAGSISGFGLNVYALAVSALESILP